MSRALTNSGNQYRLDDLGWAAYSRCFGDAISSALQAVPGSFPARVAIAHGGTYVLLSERGRERAVLKGTLKRAVRKGESKPIVGDWVCSIPPSHSGAVVIDRILPRRTKFSRSQCGEQNVEQIVATNIDMVFIVTSMNEEYNYRRLERYVTQARIGGAQPVLVLTKCDVCIDDIAEFKREAQDAFEGVSVYVISALTGEGVAELEQCIDACKTICLVGSSGVGKSSLVNRFLGEERQQVNDIRENGKGRHTTSHREMLILPSGGLLIDNPGMREIQLWEAQEEDIADTFDDIIALSGGCRFRDCRHQNEPDCAVKDAVASGKLSEERLNAWHRLHTRE